MRVLITVAPRMYRESIALTFRAYRPGFDVMISSAQTLDGPAHDFRPHLLIRNDNQRVEMDWFGDVLCWIDILYTDSMSARVTSDGKVWDIGDLSTADLLEIADRTQEMISEGHD